jgi:GNAT superfamily N-acetyltransferase
MSSVVYKIADRRDMERRWDYLVNIHPGKSIWTTFRDNALKQFDEGNIVTYMCILDGEPISELSAYMNERPFEGDISDPSGLMSDSCIYLAAFRTNREYQGMGYFSKLFSFACDDLRNKGYSELSLGVGPDNIKAMEIYFHFGFTEYIKTLIEYYPSSDGTGEPEEDVIIFYKKHI